MQSSLSKPAQLSAPSESEAAPQANDQHRLSGMGGGQVQLWDGLQVHASRLLALKHAGNADGVPSIVWPAGKRRSFSRRFLVPMPEADLRRAHYSQACAPPYTLWESPPLRYPLMPPTFIALKQIIPRVTLRKVRQQLRRISECIALAFAGHEQQAVAKRPRPLHIPLKLMFTAEASGYGPLDLVLYCSAPVPQFSFSPLAIQRTHRAVALTPSSVFFTHMVFQISRLCHLSAMALQIEAPCLWNPCLRPLMCQPSKPSQSLRLK